MHNNRQFGNTGESVVVNWLQENGFLVIARNFTTRLGEIDIIATKKEVLVFVEVKTRKIAHFHSSHVITNTKQRRIINTAKRFIQQNNITDKACRFDVALVLQGDGGYEIEYLENAFQGK